MNTALFTIDDIDNLADRAVIAGLDGVEFLADFTSSELLREYNGIGPEYLPPRLRGTLTQWLALFEPAALIHDMRNSRSAGSRYHFNYANGEFLANCPALASAAYGGRGGATAPAMSSTSSMISCSPASAGEPGRTAPTRTTHQPCRTCRI